MTDGANGTDGVAYAWAPPEPAKRKNRSGLWIGIPAGATAVALIAASLVLIAPGASVAGVQIGGLTAGAAAQAISTRLATTEVTVESPAGEVTVTGSDLGATVDATAIAEKAFADNPMWKPSAWFPAGTGVEVQVDPAAAAAVLREKAPGTYRAPVDATVAFDAGSQSYVATPAEAGEGIDVAAVTAALQSAFDAGTAKSSTEAGLVSVDAPVSTDEAGAAVATLNGVLDTVGFYVGDERTVPVDRATAASWLTVTSDGTGAFAISADQAAIQKVVDGLAGQVDRGAVNADVIVDTGGEVIKTLTEGQTGRSIGDTSGIAAAFAAQLADGNGKYALTVAETPFATAKTERNIDVNLSAQTVTLYENGQVYQHWSMSSGKSGWETHTGEFRIGWKTALQDMGCAPGYDWCTKDVPWVAYFNGDEGFHGTYWHNNFGTPMSHGCINLTVANAKLLYDWAYRGTPVSVHY